MKKIYKETIYFILSFLSILGSVFTFICLQKYIPEYFVYIYNNWNSGYTQIDTRDKCSIELFKEKSLKFYKNFNQDFFTKSIPIPLNSLSNTTNNNVESFHISRIKYFPHCLVNRSSYFDIQLHKNTTNFNQCKYIDSFNNTSCEYSYNKSYFISETTKYSDVVFSQGQPCLDPRYYNLNLTLNKTSYYYDKSKCPNNKVNNQYQFIYSLPFEDFFTFNNISRTLSDEQKNEYISVYARTYIGIKDHCRDKNYENLDIENINISINIAIIWLGYTIVLEVVIGILYVNRFLIKYYKSKGECYILPPYTNPVLLIFSLMIFAFHCRVFASLLDGIELIKLFYDVSCFEEEVQILIEPCIKYLIIACFTQAIVSGFNLILAFKFGIKKSIKYAN